MSLIEVVCCGGIDCLIMGVTAKITILMKDNFLGVMENSQNMCFVRSNEPPHCDSSLKHPKHLFCLRENQIIMHFCLDVL